MRPGHVYFTAPSGKRVLRCSTYRLKGGGFLHFDHFIQPLQKPGKRNCMAKYKQQMEGDWVKPVMKGYKMMCCDCGLVHRLDFRIKRWGRGYKVLFRAFRHRRATAAARRSQKPPPKNKVDRKRERV